MSDKRLATPWCKHYQGMSGKDVCDAGIRFDSLLLYGTRPFMSTCPCFGPKGTNCDKAEYPTADELAEQRAADEKRFADIGKARAAIVEACGGPWKRGMGAVAGSIDCPACHGVRLLRFSRSGYNGHIHAACLTDGCVRWME